MKSSDESHSTPLDNQPLFENIFIHTPVATAIISNQCTIVSLNIAFKTLFQLPDDEVTLSTPLEEIMSSFWKKTEVQHHIHFIVEGNGEPTEKIFDWQHEDGSLKYIQIQSHSLSDTQSPQPAFLLTFQDVSAVKLVEKKHNEHIRHMMHELRNPLSNISLCVELLTDSTKENNQEDTDMFLTKASASVQRMKQLINDLSAASKNA